MLALPRQFSQRCRRPTLKASVSRTRASQWRAKRSFATTTASNESEGFPIEVKKVSNTMGNGLFATRAISEGEVVFSELPLISAQLVLSKQFVRSCESCQKFLNLHKKNVLPFLPTSAEPYLPKRHSEVFNFQIGEGMRHHFCSAECLDHSFMNYFQLIDGASRSGMMQKLGQQRQKIEAEWCTALPTIPPELVLKAIALEIRTSNPKMREYHARGGNKPFAVRTPKNKLKVLEPYKPTKRPLEIDTQCAHLAEYASTLLLDYSPFNIDPPLIIDTVRRLWDVHQTIVLNVPEDKTLDNYMANGSSASTTQASSTSISNSRDGEIKIGLSKDDRAMLNTSDKEIKVSGAGDLHLVWQPVASAVYTGQALINHSCIPNIHYSTIDNHPHQLDVVAARPIAAGEQLCASYLDTALLTLPTPSRKAQITSTFGFSCECPACAASKK